MYIKVRVYVEAKKEKFLKKSENHFEISVKESAERNLANRRVLELVREYFTEYHNVKIIRGHHSPRKIISLD